MANKASKGRTHSSIKVKRAGVSNGGPKKTFARPSCNFSRGKNNNTATSLKKNMTCCPIISILVVPFHESVFNQDLVQFVNGLLRNGESVSHQVDLSAGLRVMRELPPNKNKSKTASSFQVIVPNLRENISVILDAAKIADVLLCVFPSEASYEDSCFDPLGYRTLTALRLQGLPALTVGTVVDSQGSKIGSKTVQRYFFSEFSTDKAKFVLPSADSRGIAPQVAQVISAAFSGSLSSSSAEKVRGHMLVEEINSNGSSQVIIKGFARGKGFGVTSGVVLTGCEETFRVAKIEILDPNSDMEEIIETIVPSESQVEETRKALEPLLPMEMQEQTWPTLEEEMEADAARFAAVKMKRVLVPSGAKSDMEAAWLGEDMVQDVEETVGEEEEEEGDSMMSRMFDWDKVDAKEEEGKFETRTREEMDFIDEVDTPENVSARVRFQKYRGLKSLKNGDWDPYEELPAEYSQIHEFQDSAWATKQSLAFLEQSGSVCKNKFAKIYLETVSGNNVDLTMMQSAPLVASTVAPFECKMTVVHCRVNRVAPENNVDGFPEIKNKEKIIVQCGFRRLTVSPLFSEIPKQASSVLQRMHRTLPADTSANVMMSFYAPAMFGHNPVLAFDASEKLLLWGSVSSCAPNKPIVLKRSTLTGYPFRVHQTKAVCRFMFFFPEDIEWFKPIELSTKKGLRGHIMESLGTHGYMKCRFNGQLTSDDVIFMHLYKRVFPKSS